MIVSGAIVPHGELGDVPAASVVMEEVDRRLAPAAAGSLRAAGSYEAPTYSGTLCAA